MFRMLGRGMPLILAVVALLYGGACKGKSSASSKDSSVKKNPSDGLAEVWVRFSGSNRSFKMRILPNMESKPVKYDKGYTARFGLDDMASGRSRVLLDVTEIVEAGDEDEDDGEAVKTAVQNLEHFIMTNNGEIKRSEKLKNGHLLVSRTANGNTWINVIRPAVVGRKKGHLKCSVEVRKTSAKLVPLAEKACRSMKSFKAKK